MLAVVCRPRTRALTTVPQAYRESKPRRRILVSWARLWLVLAKTAAPSTLRTEDLLREETALTQAFDTTPLVDWRACDRHVIGGLDHLGVSAFSIAVYNVLLPGVTNVTDRARYYSFYPWIIHAYARSARSDDRKRWLTWYRRLDYAYALASTAAELRDRGSARGVVGADRARAQLKNETSSKWCDLKAADLDREGRVPVGAYFKNPQGGYGQYYKAVLRSLGLFVESQDEHQQYPDMQLTTYAGLPLAESMQGQPAFGRLCDIAHAGGATVRDLAEVGAQVGPSAIQPESEEHRLLCRLFWGEDDAVCRAQSTQNRQWRRNTLETILSFVHAVHPETGSRKLSSHVRRSPSIPIVW
jgi:hypothetical protein